jgi:hypothetical protein
MDSLSWSGRSPGVRPGREILTSPGASLAPVRGPPWLWTGVSSRGARGGRALRSHEGEVARAPVFNAAQISTVLHVHGQLRPTTAVDCDLHLAGTAAVAVRAPLAAANQGHFRMRGGGRTVTRWGRGKRPAGRGSSPVKSGTSASRPALRAACSSASASGWGESIRATSALSSGRQRGLHTRAVQCSSSSGRQSQASPSIGVRRWGVLLRDEAIGGDTQGEEVIRGPRGIGDQGLAGVADEAPRLGRAVGRSAGRKGLQGEGRGAQVVAGAEVQEEGLIVRAPDADVVPLHITVEASSRMGGGQDAGQPGQQLKHLPRRRALGLGPVIKWRALHPLHDEPGEGESLAGLPVARRSVGRECIAR